MYILVFMANDNMQDIEGLIAVNSITIDKIKSLKGCLLAEVRAP